MWADASIASDLSKLSPSCSGETTSDRPIAVHGILSHHRLGLMVLTHDISVPVVPAGRFERNKKGCSFPGYSGELSSLQGFMDGKDLPVQEQSYGREVQQ